MAPNPAGLGGVVSPHSKKTPHMGFMTNSELHKFPFGGGYCKTTTMASIEK